jgi:hypothetical protein
VVSVLGLHQHIFWIHCFCLLLIGTQECFQN